MTPITGNHGITAVHTVEIRSRKDGPMGPQYFSRLVLVNAQGTPISLCVLQSFSTTTLDLFRRLERSIEADYLTFLETESWGKALPDEEQSEEEGVEFR